MTRAGAIARTAGVLGHELRNPLAAAVTGTALLREMLDAVDPRRGVVDGVALELQRLARLIDGYLDLARCGRPQQLPVALARVCAAVAARRSAPVTVTVDVAAEAIVSGDAVLIERAIENLVENALHAGAQAVHVSARVRDHHIALVVADDGPGVPPALRGRIFEPGFSRSGGTGLGLGIVAEVVKAHAGTVRCEARSKGARFVIELPRLAVAIGATPAGS